MEKINLHNYEAYFLDFAEGNLSDAQIQQMEEFLNLHPELRTELEDFEPISISDINNENLGWNDLKKPTFHELENDKELRDAFFIRAIENLLTSYEKKILDDLLENTGYADEFAIWEKTILEENRDEKINTDSLFQFGLDLPLTDFNYDAWLTAKTEGLLDLRQLEALTAFAKNKVNGEQDLQLADNLRIKPAQGIFFPDKSKLYKEENRRIIPLWIYRAAAIAAIFLFGIFIWNKYQSPSVLDRPVAQKKTIEPKEVKGVDTVKTKILPDTLRDDKSLKSPILDEWQIREPDPTEYAETNTPETKKEEINTIPEKEKAHVPIDMPEPEIAEVVSSEINITEIADQPVPATPQKPTFKTLPQLAEKALAEKLNVPEEDQNEMANIVAHRITEKVSKMLDTEIKSESTQNDENNTMSYTLRIGSFEFSRTKQK